MNKTIQMETKYCILVDLKEEILQLEFESQETRDDYFEKTKQINPMYKASLENNKLGIECDGNHNKMRYLLNKYKSHPVGISQVTKRNILG